MQHYLFASDLLVKNRNIILPIVIIISFVSAEMIFGPNESTTESNPVIRLNQNVLDLNMPIIFLIIQSSYFVNLPIPYPAVPANNTAIVPYIRFLQ